MNPRRFVTALLVSLGLVVPMALPAAAFAKEGEQSQVERNTRRAYGPRRYVPVRRAGYRPVRVVPAYPVPVVPARRFVVVHPAPPVVVVPPPPPVVAVAPRPVAYVREAPPPAPARPSDPRLGLYLGAGGAGLLLAENRESDITHVVNNGGGFELFGGLRFSRVVAAELGWLASFHATDPTLATFERGMLNGVTLDLKVFPVPGSMRIEPFLQAGAGFYAFNSTFHDDLALMGGGFQLGGGVDIRFTDDFVLGLRMLYRGIYVDNSETMYDYGRYYAAPAFESAYMNAFTVAANFQVHF